MEKLIESILRRTEADMNFSPLVSVFSNLFPLSIPVDDER